MSGFECLPLADLVLDDKMRGNQDDDEVWNLNLDQIEPDSGRILEKIRVPPNKLGPSTYPFTAGTVLYSKLRPYLNKVVVADEDGVATTELVPLRCNPEKVLPSYLAYFLRSSEFLNFANTVVAGAKMPRMVMSEFWRYPVPTPPLSEQRRIAAILDKADALRAKRREALTQLDRLAQSIFVEMFGDPIENPKGWASDLTLGDVADIVSGVTKGRNLTGKTTREVPYLAVSNVQDMRLSLDAVKVIEATEAEIVRYSLRNGDLLLTEGGDPDKLGRGTLWRSQLPECIHQNHVFRVRLKSNRLTPHYLNWLIGSQRGKQYFLKSAKQTTGIASINMTQLRGFPLLIPPLERQQKFDALLNAIANWKKSLEKSMQALDEMFSSVQSCGFKGELE